MTEHKYTDEEVIKAFDILDKFEFFGGQRAGRELWFNKPTDIQNKDIGDFLRDLDFLKQFINRQKAEIEKMRKVINADLVITRRRSGKSQYANEIIRIKTDLVKAQAIKEFADKLKEKSSSFVAVHNGIELPETRTYQITAPSLDDLVKELTEEKT